MKVTKLRELNFERHGASKTETLQIPHSEIPPKVFARFLSGAKGKFAHAIFAAQ
jgi:hypothetical protein